jgi:hypothetical protein
MDTTTDIETTGVRAALPLPPPVKWKARSTDGRREFVAYGVRDAAEARLRASGLPVDFETMESDDDDEFSPRGMQDNPRKRAHEI